MVRQSLILAGMLALLAGCGRDEPKGDMTPLTGVGGNPYCVTDQEEYSLSREARTDLVAAWRLIHHYQNCELDRDKAGTLLQYQLSKDETKVMEALADFNARIEAGRRLIAASPEK